MMVLIATPTLCVGGVIHHACAEHSGSGCPHEGSCSDDPCTNPSMTARYQVGQNVQHVFATPTPIPQSFPSFALLLADRTIEQPGNFCSVDLPCPLISQTISLQI